MRVIKDRTKRDASDYEIFCSAFEPRRKILAAGSWKEPILLYRYPYLKLFKKIIHRQKIPISETEAIHESSDKIQIDDDGHKFLKGSTITPDHLLFTKSGNELIIGYKNGDLLVFNTTQWKKVYHYKFPVTIGSMQLVHDGKHLFVSTQDWHVYLLDTLNWKIIETKELNEKHDGTIIATDNLAKIYAITDKKRVTSYDYKTMEELQIFKGHNRGINKFLLSPDEKILATSGMDCKLCLFDTTTGELLSYLIEHSDEVHQFIFTADGKYLLSSSEDENMKLWSIRNYKCIHTTPRVPNALSMNRYGNIVLMGNVKGELRTFKVF